MTTNPLMNRDGTPRETVETEPLTPPTPDRGPQGMRFALGGAIGVVVIGVGTWVVATLTPDRTRHLFDFAVAGVIVVLLSWAARYLLRAEAIRRSRLVAAELIGVTFGGAALATFLVTSSSDPVGVARVGALIVIQLLAAVLGGGAVFLLAFFITFGVKAAGRLSRSHRPEVEAIFIGVVTGAISGGLTAKAAELDAWFPFLAAAVCAATTYRAVVLHQRYDRE